MAICRARPSFLLRVFQEIKTVRVVAEDLLAFVPANRDVIAPAGSFDA